ncbi:bifunctional diaminohydroxyphosphoribosylaminopyrimidine deaminase/5-amino-6-(5-phosphoribosylamino)uracil reductase RibD [Ornithinimicrobium tianjinense]|uniref:Riboflavin biosynthesis protein RibD n=1 Tax=Ornithinimicrobium tianjinense TaxID=1195761 RepID=A0A917BRC5_9MICO|nr:bifunctional diaminohydroxyphosphoribosylaminopyrimidine deaminase/5-amino-6-(5-phosphoribosylamino)uracil reductase RibD [Ornithinimicrobium tianjinense]GGF55902.1 riboflavin biosynthesis protein RibD [Ornithinimicrobium tianjinense]
MTDLLRGRASSAGPPPAALADALRRAVTLARRGPARDPNPRVGCVLLDDRGRTVGEGFHAGAGSPHAEVVALAGAGTAARGCTAVVTLEPCAHTGRTGPCVEALHRAGVAAVRYAVPDPTPSAGGGAAALAAAGVDVARLPDDEAEELVADWGATSRRGRPHVTWKIASTLDGRVAAADGSSRWITSPEARAAAHALRSRVDAVVVGTGTALTDDPALTARGPRGRLALDQPLRVVVGARDLPADARLHGPGGQVVHLRTHDPAAVLADLRERGAHRVLLEGGPTLAGAFWRAGLVDELLVHLAPALLGAGGAPAVPDLGIPDIEGAARLELVSLDRLGPDLQLRLRPLPARPTDLEV